MSGLLCYAYAEGFAPAQVAYPNGSGETIYDVHSDHLDTPRMLTDEFDVPSWRASYEAFGRAHISTDPDGTPVTLPPDFDFTPRFPGQYYDTESGLHYNRHRYYSPELGRYISADPAGQSDHLNVYQYALNNPLVLSDPLGLEVRINARAVRGTTVGGITGGAHTSTSVTTSSGTTTTGGSYWGDQDQNQFRFNDPSDHGPNADPQTDSVVVPPPPGMSQDDWDQAVLDSMQSIANSPPQQYHPLATTPAAPPAAGNCHTTTTGIIEGAGGAIPPGFNPPGLNPGLGN